MDGQEAMRLISGAMKRGNMTVVEEQKLAEFFNPMPTLKSWIKGGTGNPIFRSFEFGEAILGPGTELPHEGWRVHRSENQGIAASSELAITYAGANFDTADSHNSFGYWDSTAPTRITIPPGQTGYYTIVCRTQWAQITDGKEALVKGYITNSAGTSLIAADQRVAGAAAAGVVYPHAGTNFFMEAGDYMEFKAQHGDAGSINITSATCWGFRWR